MKFLGDFNKAVSKMGDGVNTDTSPPKYWFGSGNYVLNKIVSGDYHKCIAQGRVTGFAGPSGSGKSFLLANVVKQAQKEGAYILLLDSEGAFDDDWATAIGIDVTNENYNCIQVCTIPQVVKIISAFTKGYRGEYPDGNGPKVLIAVDSCDMLMTDTESDKYDKGNTNADQGQHPKQIKQMLKTFVNDFKSLNVSMVVTKQVYPANAEQKLKGEGLWIVNDAIRYSLSQILLITKLKLKDDKESTVNGIRMKVEGFKTRFTKPFQKVTVEVPYDTGMDPYSGLLDVALGTGAVIRKGAWYYLADDMENKWNGEKNMTEAHYEAILSSLCKQADVFLTVDESIDEEDIPLHLSRSVQLTNMVASGLPDDD